MKLTELRNLIVSKDLQNLYYKDLRKIAKKLNYKSNLSSYVKHKLSLCISKHDSNILSILSKYSNKLFTGRSISWYKLINYSLMDLIKYILRMNSGIKFRSTNGSKASYTEILGIAHFDKYVPKSYIVRYKCVSRNRGIYDVNGNYILTSKASYASVIIIPNKNILEMRASSTNVGQITDTIIKLYNGKISQADIKPIYIGNKIHFRSKIKSFKSHTHATLNESVNIPSQEKNEKLLKGKYVERIVNILKVIDKRINGKKVNVNSEIDNLQLPLPLLGDSFSLLLLLGLKKLDVKSDSDTDLANTPLYAAAENSSNIRTNSIIIPISGHDYTVSFNKDAGTVRIYQDATEQLISIVRNGLILG